MLIEQLQNFPDMLLKNENGDYIRNTDHLVVGVLKYQDLKKENSNLFEVFQALVSTNFERILFAELPHSFEKVQQIEDFVLPKEEFQRQFKQYRCSHFMYSRKSADILLMNMMFQQEGGDELFG